MHEAPAGHTVPHPPQLFGSVPVSVHVPEQLVCPAVGQVHTPAAQMSPAGHAFPHAPQLFRSVLGSTHVPPQSIVPGAHRLTHVPPLHVLPAGHVTPHAPQLFTSVWKFVQSDGLGPPKQQLLSPAAPTASWC